MHSPPMSASPSEVVTSLALDASALETPEGDADGGTILSTSMHWIPMDAMHGMLSGECTRWISEQKTAYICLFTCFTANP